MRGRGVCMAGRACVAGGHAWWGGMRDGGGHAWQEKRQLQRAVRILRECILVFCVIFRDFSSLLKILYPDRKILPIFQVFQSEYQMSSVFCCNFISSRYEWDPV